MFAVDGVFSIIILSQLHLRHCDTQSILMTTSDDLSVVFYMLNSLSDYS